MHPENTHKQNTPDSAEPLRTHLPVCCVKSCARSKWYPRRFKRLIDIVLSLAGLLIFSIPLLLVAILIKINDPGPALFKQKRVGKDKKLFALYKFRSMKVSTPANTPTHLLTNPDQYITGMGTFMRKFGIDELPQMFNILKGDMSIIGPRPALWNQDDLVAERDQYGANDILPGLTGWAQINGRDMLSISAKARLDGEYVQRMSFLFDARCFFETILILLKNDGTGTQKGGCP